MLRKWFLSHNLVSEIIKTLKFHPFIQHFSGNGFCINTTTTTTTSESASESDTHPFPVSYLINNFGFSTQSAINVFNQKQVCFKSPDKPNSVLTFFKNHHFSDSNLCNMVRKSPWLLSAKPHKNLLPKFQFFLSEGVSSSDIVPLLTENPRILRCSLEKRIIPLFELLSRFFKTNKDVIVCLIRHSSTFERTPCDLIVANINLMTDFGVCNSNIATLFQTKPSIFGSTDLVKSLNKVKGLGFNPSTSPKLHSCIQHFSRFCRNTTITTSESESDTQPFAVSYLINNFGFSTQYALSVFNQKQVCFKSPDKPNSVVNFFKNHDFSDSDIRIMVRKSPKLLSAEPHKILLPKFQFLVSKGVSSSDIIPMLTANPRILHCSLEKRIIPFFELLSRFFKTNKDVIVCLIIHPDSFNCTPYDLIVANINLMTDFGVCNYGIARLFQRSPSIFGSTDLIKSLEEVRGLGFNPSTSTFEVALIAKKCMSKKCWDKKVDTFKKWGWSVEDVLQAFRTYPSLMLVSIDKVNLVMSFWVNQLGWNSLALTKCPLMFQYSLHKRIIPRASVLQFLLMKGLGKKNASLVTPFSYTDKKFLDKFVFSFKKESDYLLKLYEEQMELYTQRNTMACHSLIR